MQAMNWVMTVRMESIMGTVMGSLQKTKYDDALQIFVGILTYSALLRLIHTVKLIICVKIFID